MALRDQPYLPLYIQDFLTDEKLRECSPESIGVYIMIMCIMHKSKDYGIILLGQKDKQNPQQNKNFACKLVRHLPWPELIILKCLDELLNEKVLLIDGDQLMQKRMVEDNRISLLRSKAGSKGFFAKAKISAKGVANTENETVIENESNITHSNGEKTENFTIIETYLNDLPNSQELENISRTTGIQIDALIAYIPNFKKRTRTNYKNFFDFVDHFKFSYLKKEENKPVSIIKKSREIK